MYCVHLYSLHVKCALVDLGSSGSPGVRPTLGLTSSTQVVYVCVRAYTSTHTPTTLRLDHQPTTQHMYGQMYSVHLYSLHVHGALVEVGSSCHSVCVSVPHLVLH